MSKLIKYGGMWERHVVIKKAPHHRLSLQKPTRTLSFETIKVEDVVSWVMDGYLHQGEVDGIIYKDPETMRWAPRNEMVIPGVTIDVFNRDYTLFVPPNQIHLLNLDHSERN